VYFVYVTAGQYLLEHGLHCHPSEFGARNSELLSYYEIVIFRRIRKIAKSDY